MKPNTRLSLGLIFGLLVVLVGLILRTNWVGGDIASRTPTITPRPKLLDLNALNITQLQVVDTTTNDRFVAKRNAESKWDIVQAKQGVETKYGVDSVRIENAVSILASITANRSISQIEALADYGLDKPKYQVIITASGKDISLLIGSENPDKSSYYVKTSITSDVYLISTFNLDSLIEFLTDPPYVKATPAPGAELLTTPTETPTLSGSPTEIPTVFINITVQFTPRPTQTPTPSDTPTATPSPQVTPTKGK